MSISVGDRLPEATFRLLGSEGIEKLTTDEVFAGKKVVLFAVPGAFTPTCHLKHLPGFLDNADAFKKKGVHTVACVAVNDPFVMDAWAKADDRHRLPRLHKKIGVDQNGLVVAWAPPAVAAISAMVTVNAAESSGIGGHRTSDSGTGRR